MGVTPDDTTIEQAAADPAQGLAAFYDRRAPAALAYCARMCEPESIADAVEEAFGQVFARAAGGERLSDEELEAVLRDAVRSAAASRASEAFGKRDAARKVEDAERAYEALCGDDAPALGRSLLGEMIEAEPFAWPTAEPAAPSERAASAAPAERAAPAAPAGPAGPAALVEPESIKESGPAGEVAPVPVGESAAPAEAASGAEPAAAEPRPRRFLRGGAGWRRRLVVVMAVVGTLLLAEAAVTLAWKEPVTAYLAARAQDDLDKQLDELGSERVSLAASDQRSLAAIRDADERTEKRMSLLAARLDESAEEGEALGRIQIDRIGADFVFVQGIEGASLRKGPGHYDGDTPLPGQGGAVGIAGHRTTYEAPFREIDSLEKGDRITLRMPYGAFTYEVTGHRIVPADYGEAFTTEEAGSGDRLVLSACHPLYSSDERILIDAKLIASEPLGSAIEPGVPAVPGRSEEEIARRRTAARLERLGDRQLVPGLTGPDVRELQRLLGMPITGTFDPNTSAAVLAFQADHELPQVGVVGSQTKRALARQPRLPSRPPTPADVPQQEPPGPTGAQGQQPGGYYGNQGTAPTTPAPESP